MSEESKTVELKEEDLEKVSGGATNDLDSYQGYSKGQSHTAAFSDGMGRGQKTVTINKIQPLNLGGAPFEVSIYIVYDSGDISSGSSFWNKSQLDAFWNS